MGRADTVCVNSLGVMVLGGSAIPPSNDLLSLGVVVYKFKLDRCDVHSLGCDADTATGTDTEIIGIDLVCDHTTDAGPEPTNTASLCLVDVVNGHVHE